MKNNSKKIMVGVFVFVFVAAGFFIFTYLNSMPTSLADGEKTINNYLPYPHSISQYLDTGDFNREGCDTIEATYTADPRSVFDVKKSIIKRLRSDGWQLDKEIERTDDTAYYGLSRHYVNIFKPDIYGLLSVPTDDTNQAYVRMVINLNTKRCAYG
jgi:hypothetical protein